MSHLTIEISGAVLAGSEPEALSAAIEKGRSYVQEGEDVEVHIVPSKRHPLSNFLEWGIDIRKNKKRVIYLGMVQRHATAPFEFHS